MSFRITIFALFTAIFSLSSSAKSDDFQSLSNEKSYGNYSKVLEYYLNQGIQEVHDNCNRGRGLNKYGKASVFDRRLYEYDMNSLMNNLNLTAKQANNKLSAMRKAMNIICPSVW